MQWQRVQREWIFSRIHHKFQQQSANLSSGATPIIYISIFGFVFAPTKDCNNAENVSFAKFVYLTIGRQARAGFYQKPKETESDPPYCISIIEKWFVYSFGL